MKFYLYSWLFLLVSIASCQPTEPYVLLVSFDGFRHDYAEKHDLKNFKKLAREGVAAESLIPSFPSKTFPNHYTIVTGLYPGNHGLIDNGFYDREMDAWYSTRNRTLVEDPVFYGGKPLWQLVQEYGMKSASYFWVGSESEIDGRYPDYYFKYDGKVANDDRIEQVEEWFNLNENERPNFVTLYFSLVDDGGHDSGPEGKTLIQSVKEADRLLGMIIKVIEGSDLPINLIVVSDHGMYPIKQVKESFISIQNLLKDEKGTTHQTVDTHSHIYVESTSEIQKIHQTLKSKENNFKVYLKQETPPKWEYSKHPRIGDIFLTADQGYVFTRGSLDDIPNTGQIRGTHGYDPYSTPEMGGIFYAWGPNIKKGLSIEAFENVHVYPLIGMLLGIEADTEDSNPKVLEGILK